MDIAAEFPGVRTSTYLNSCAHGLLPTRTRHAIDAHLDAWAALPDWSVWMAEVEKARAAFARLIHARGPEDVAVVSNASEGISMALSTLRPGSTRKRIVTTALDFPAAPTLAHRSAQHGFLHQHVPGVPGTGDVGAETALVSMPLVASFTGRRMDARSIAVAAHAAGAQLRVDAFQAAGRSAI